MGIISLTLPTDGQSAAVASVNTPLTTIANAINGNIDNTNIAAAAAISGSKLASNSVDLGSKTSQWDGWVAVQDSWAFASASTVTVPSDATTKYSVGDKVKFTQTSIKYFYIIEVTSTTLKLTAGSDNTVANAAISGIYYSKVVTPVGFPKQFARIPTATNFTVGNGVFAANFNIQGGMVFDYGSFTLGTTSAVSTGPTFSAAVPLAGTFGNFFISGADQYFDSSAGTFYPGMIYVSNVTANAFLLDSMRVTTTPSSVQNQGGIQSNTPFIWGVGDGIYWNVSYPLA